MNFQKIFDQNVPGSFTNATMLPMTSFKKLSVILIFEDPSLRSGCPPMAERTFCQSGKCDFSIIDGHPERREGSSIGPYHRQICFYQNLGKFCLRMTANAVANTRRRYGGINPHTEGILISHSTQASRSAPELSGVSGSADTASVEIPDKSSLSPVAPRLIFRDDKTHNWMYVQKYPDFPRQNGSLILFHPQEVPTPDRSRGGQLGKTHCVQPMAVKNTPNISACISHAQACHPRREAIGDLRSDKKNYE